MRTQDAVPTESCGGGGVLWTIKIAFLFMRAVTQKPTKQKKKKQKVPPLTMLWTRGPQLKFRSPIQTHTHTK